MSKFASIRTALVIVATMLAAPAVWAIPAALAANVPGPGVVGLVVAGIVGAIAVARSGK